jgi:hypothetical protein
MGSPVWAYWYSFPQTTEKMIDDAFAQIVELWTPIFDEFDKYGRRWEMTTETHEDFFQRVEKTLTEGEEQEAGDGKPRAPAKVEEVRVDLETGWCLPIRLTKVNRLKMMNTPTLLPGRMFFICGKRHGRNTTGIRYGLKSIYLWCLKNRKSGGMTNLLYSMMTFCKPLPFQGSPYPGN